MNEDRSQEPTWIKNRHGVKSCWSLESATEMVSKNYGWSFCEADDVPEQKQYPIGRGELTKEGLERRVAAQESIKVSKAIAAEEGIKEVSLVDLRAKAKTLGVDKYWVKSGARLKKEIADYEKVAAVEK